MLRLSGLTGVLAGSAIVALGFVASTVIAPPLGSPPNVAVNPSVPSENQPAAPAETAPNAPRTENAEATTGDVAPAAEPEPAALAEAPAEAEMTRTLEDAAEDLPPSLPDMNDPESQDAPAAFAEAFPPTMPEPILRPAPAGLPGSPVAPRGTEAPQSPEPPDQDSLSRSNADLDEDAEPEDPMEEAVTDAPAPVPSLPGTRVAGLPGVPATPQPQSEDASDIVPLATALERNSSFEGPITGGPLMAIILNDPGLPTPLRRSLAALDLPVTIALNPMDPSAGQGAEIYREAGKDVLILANGLPARARASDLDVTFSAWFDSLPQAVGVVDLPRGGFARNATLTSEVLPLIARDGHGLVSFAGGLSRMAAAAQSQGVPHAEVFRVLDDESQSAFTIRRYLDRAVFQASQIGEVLVYGDAANDETMEALEIWRSDGRADQVLVVPVSAILLTR